jgi:hypothetical protein
LLALLQCGKGSAAAAAPAPASFFFEALQQ